MSELNKQVGGEHYKSLPVQPVEYCQKNRLGYCESIAIRYITRHRAKDGRRDIEKAIHALGMLLDLEYPLPKSAGEGAMRSIPEVCQKFYGKGWECEACGTLRSRHV